MISIWERNRGKMFSTGGIKPGEGVLCHGYNMMEDLVGKVTFFQVLILNVTGRLVEKRVADWLEGFYICLSYPDPRLWCNQMGSLAGSVGVSPMSAVSMGVLASDSHLYGPGSAKPSAIFIQEALKLKQSGLTAREIVDLYRNDRSKPPILGYNTRPMLKGDERIVPLQQLMFDLGFTIGPHLELAYEIEKVIGEKSGETMNVMPFRTAFCSDLGFTPEEQVALASPAVFSGVAACYIEATHRPPGTFFPLRCEDIDYQGVSPRPVPR